MNKAQLIGRVTRDIEMRMTQSQTPVVSFSLAVDKRNKEDGADFISCVAFGKMAEAMNKFVRKGQRIGVSGRIQTRSYKNKDGKTVYVTEVVLEELDFLERKADESPAASDQYAAEDYTNSDDDDLPF